MAQRKLFHFTYYFTSCHLCNLIIAYILCRTADFFMQKASCETWEINYSFRATATDKVSTQKIHSSLFGVKKETEKMKQKKRKMENKENDNEDRYMCFLQVCFAEMYWNTEWKSNWTKFQLSILYFVVI